jgi:hypothetical protein
MYLSFKTKFKFSCGPVAPFPAYGGQHFRKILNPMKNITRCGHCLFFALLVLAGVHHASAQGTAFVYQGNLDTNSIPANGFFDFEFSLYTNSEGTGTKVGSTITQTNLGVTNGLFKATLDFGDVFTGNDTWLAMSVRSNGVGSYTPLTPLFELTPTPYAVFANTASNLSGKLPAAQISGDLPAAQISGELPATQISGTLKVTQLPSAVLTNDEGGVTLSNVTVVGNLTLPAPTPAAGVIYAGSDTWVHGDANNDFFAGPDAGNLINTDGGNTGIGYQSLAKDTNGTKNTAVGYQTLKSTTSGSNNIALGYQAGANYTGKETGNIAIGSLGVAGENNTIRIGTGQTSTLIAGVIKGNGSGLTTLNATELTSGTIPLARLSSAVLTNNEPGLSVGTLTLSGSLNLPSPANISMGSSSLFYANSFKGDFFAGPSAGNLTATGGYLTAIGSGALLFNTTGTDNTACGPDALFENSTGSYNTALGAAALENNSTGSSNTAVGLSALAANSSGYGNTAMGFGAMLNNTTGNNNAAYGVYSMGGVSAGTDGGNSAIGGYTLYDITTGYNNTAAGFEALEDDSSGFDNVGLGVATFQNNAAGYQNTACGTYAFQNMTTGTGNIGLGVYAGYWLDAGTNNIYIGNYGDPHDNEVIRIGQSQTETYIAGAVTVCSLTIAGGCDLAEPFPMSPAEQQVSEGAVVVIDETNPGQVKLSNQPYDTKVAGVVSGANGVHPGIQMHQQGLLDGGMNVALTGRVYVQADASNGAIQPGDLLTTSSTPGRAMKVSDHVRAQGAILGKAMTALNDGQGMVLVLVTLQ